ncbi:helix-turn-helix domain-containing protein [Streptomyces sp. 2RAF24]|uniref:helix-turn-helix domain-containing protein n=1 Tax=Streptomyces sp. 2RAF24 TaxID=3232997 RepID=UPI003F967A73
MGRTENPIDYTNAHRGLLAELLRKERQRNPNLSYAQMAAREEVSAATLKRAASGKHTPSIDTIEAYLSACGSNYRTVRKALELRNKARRDERGGRGKVYVDGINTPDALLDALITLHRNHGAPTYREMQERAGGPHLLPLSSISRILNREMLPVDRPQMAAFLDGCVMDKRSHERWMQAWARIKEPGKSGFFVSRAVLDEVQRVVQHRSREEAIARRLTRMDASPPIADPAMGTASFLLGAATRQMLLHSAVAA